MGAAEEAFPVVQCAYCRPVAELRLKLVDPYRNPECFWLSDSYWRHCWEAHDPACAWVGERLVSYLEGRLPPEDDMRVMLHLGGCKDCHRGLIRRLAAGEFAPLGEHTEG